MTALAHIQGTPNRRSRFDVVVQPSFLLDVLMTLWSALGGDEKVGAQELGKRWFDDVRRRIPPDVADDLVSFGGERGKVWLTFITWVASAPDPSDTEATLDWMATSDWAERRRAVMSEMCWKVDPLDIDGAIAGDADSVGNCLAQIDESDREALERWITYPAETFPLVAVGALRRIVQEVLSDEATEWTEAHRRSAEAVRPLIDMMEPADLIERVTNGIAYAIPLGIRRLVLVPSVSLRPWTLADEIGDTIHVFYPVSDEHLDGDPDAPPQWLVRFHKALGDDRRMRMLHRLAEGPASLAELTETVGLAKSTVFHHLGILRAAGLLRVNVGAGKESSHNYELRRQALATASEVTDRYLGGDEEGATR
jgi:DNA-binding transcriptional ArsR family regulator